MEKFIRHLKKNNYSPNTIITYKNIIKKYLNHYHDIRLIKKQIIKYSSKPNTCWTHYNVVSSFMKYKKDKRIASLKQLKLPPIPQIYRPIFSKSYLYSRTEDITIYKNIIIRLLFETGIRVSELSKIFDIQNKTFKIRGKGNKIREVFHNNETTKHFKGINVSYKTIRLWVKEVLGREYSPHSIRRSHATHLLLAGANPKMVMMQLGHTKIETTYKYLNMSSKENQKIYSKFF